jgi:RNA polymerase sigma-70 factor (ECF subfamily)
LIRQALEGLNERQRMAVLLNKFEDMNYAEIAEVMGLTTKAVKSLLCRARTNLRAALQDYVYMDGEAVPDAPREE